MVTDADVTAWSGFTQQQINKRIINALDFGLDLTNVDPRNNSIAINSALAYANSIGGGVVELPSGEIIVDRVDDKSTINADLDVCINLIYNNVSLKGQGRNASIIKKAQNSKMAYVLKLGRTVTSNPIAVKNIVVSDLTVIGNLDVVTTEPYINSNIGVSQNAENITIERVNSLKSVGYGIGFGLSGFKNCVIRDCFISECWHDAIDFKMAVNEEGFGNLIDHVVCEKFGLGYAVLANPQAGINVRQGVSITNCYIRDFSGNVTGLRIDANATQSEYNQSVINNVHICGNGATSTDLTKGLHVTGGASRLSNIHIKDVDTAIWHRASDVQLSNINIDSAYIGVFIYGNTGQDSGRNLYSNLTIKNCLNQAIRIFGDADKISNNIFTNVACNNNVKDVFISANAKYTYFIGDKLDTVEDNSSTSQFFSYLRATGNIRVGRNGDQFFNIWGDAFSNNVTSSFNPLYPKPTYYEVDETGQELRLRTKADFDIVAYRNNAVKFRITANNVLSGQDNTQSLGFTNNRWSTVYAGTGTINTSDQRFKEQIFDLDDAEQRVALACKSLIKKFKFKDAVAEKGSNARWHIGIIAQEVIAAFESENLDPFAYGILCYDEWQAQDEVIQVIPAVDAIYEAAPDGTQILVREAQDEKIIVVSEAVESGNRYSIRYDELSMFILATL